MKRQSKFKQVFLGALAALSFAACNKAPLYPMAPGVQMGMQQNFRSFANARSSVSNPAGTIELSFVNAYGRSALENEQISRKDPNSPAAMLIRQIQSARKSLDGSFYDIDNEDIVKAFIAAKKRGIQVRMVTDTDNMTAKNTGPTGPARPAIVALQQAGIPVVDDKRSGIMHNKFLVIDGLRVWTGSTNLTNTSLYQHNNNALTLVSPQLAASYTAEFERLFTHKLFGPNPPRQVPYPSVQIGTTQVNVFFSPRGGGQQAVLQELQSARQRILFMTFSLTDKTAGEIIQQKMAQGLQVEGVFDSWLGASQYSLFNPLKESGLNVRKDGNEALLHHKVIIVDNTVITGSYNYSANAENSNNENFLIIKNAPEIAQAYIEEYQRIRRISRPGVAKPSVLKN